MIDVSIIVAVYQAEKYLRRCLESFKNQTFSNYEVILVDDGSKDCSGEICDEYAKTDKRFKVIHKKNGGVSSARQCGLENANGEYIIHVDPDDWIEPTMLAEQILVAKENNSDVVICDFYEECINKQVYIQQKPSALSHTAYYMDLISEKLHGSCCNKLIRKNCILKNKIRFQTDMIMREDELFNIQLAQNPITISYLPKAFYHYDKTSNSNSIVNSYSEKKLNSLIYLIHYLQKHSVDEALLIERKKNAKQTAFMLKNISTESFRQLFSEINSLYTLKLSRIGHLDFFIALTRYLPTPLTRTFFLLKDKIYNYKNYISNYF